MLVLPGRLLPGRPAGRMGVMRPFIDRGVLRAPFVLTRAQAGGARSTALGPDGVSIVEFNADVPRFNGAARRLWLEGQRTNFIRNPRAEGSTVGQLGAGGALPTNWVQGTPSGGAVVHVVGTGTEAGLPYIDLRWAFSAAGACRIQFDAPAIAASTAHTLSAYVRIVAGSLTSIGINGIALRWIDVATGGNNTVDLTTISGSTQRYAVTGTSSAGATLGRPEINVGATLAADITLRISAPQMEAASFASTPILPAAATPATSTRGADLVAATLASLGVGANGACTVIGTAMIPQAAPSTASQTIIQIDRGDNVDRFFLRVLAGGAAVTVGRSTTGATVSSPTIDTMIAGTAFRFGLTITGSGRIAGTFNGGVIQEATGGPTSGLTALRVGVDGIGAANLFGEVGSLRVLPFPVSDTELQRLVAEQPT